MSAYDPIAATCRLALIGAAIGIDLIAVIAGLGTGSDDAVAAARRCAGIQARVGINLITIIAGFIALGTGI